jgi:hypothetical protein
VVAVSYCAFVDPSGGSSDSYAMAVAHATEDGGKGGKIILDGIWEKRPPFSPAEATAEFAATLKGYNVNTVQGDHYGGLWPRESFAEHGIGYEPSPKTKSQLYAEFLVLLNSGKVSLPRHPRLLAQLIRLERRVSRGGKESIDHGIGGHDDLSNVAAGAVCLAHETGAKDAEPTICFVPFGQPRTLPVNWKYAPPRDEERLWHKIG